MSKSKTETKRKRQKPQEAPTKAERCKWDPSYCARVEALGAQGKSAPEIRKELGISPSAWRSWVKKHAEFADAVEQAADLAEAWWIDVGRKGMMLGTAFSAQTFIYLTKEHFSCPVQRPAGPSDLRTGQRPHRAGAARPRPHQHRRSS